MMLLEKSVNKVAEKPVDLNGDWLERYHPYLQLAFNVVALFIANDIAVEIWRSMTGH
jgi:hypothetical protein